MQAYLRFRHYHKRKKFVQVIMQAYCWLLGLAGKYTYRIFYWLDKRGKHIEDYSYETAPYCGHHYSGHSGKYTTAAYHEGDGSKLNNKLLWLVSCGHHTDEGWFFTLFPPLWELRRQLQLFFKSLKIENTKEFFFLHYHWKRRTYLRYYDRNKRKFKTIKLKA